jgi:hypothetical protein
MKQVVVIIEGGAKVEYLKLKQVVDLEIKKGVLKSNNQTLFNSINKKIELLKTNPVAGRAVIKSLIPYKYKNQGITNLWVLDLPNFWRMIYNIKTDEIRIVCFILEYGDHNKYSQLFGFKKK